MMGSTQWATAFNTHLICLPLRQPYHWHNKSNTKIVVKIFPKLKLNFQLRNSEMLGFKVRHSRLVQSQQDVSKQCLLRIVDLLTTGSKSRA
jgi:hypothetical protein